MHVCLVFLYHSNKEERVSLQQGGTYGIELIVVSIKNNYIKSNHWDEI